ncbi:MAG: YggS family pyridoxal phosphate-dependent enzyme, partial [Chlorobi bacterium]|nr:YggS family pyridoxal phosphate-dependent enzyme [Chlorobiota bacterium]
MSIAENIRIFKENIPDNVRLVAVSKTKPVEAIREAYETGHLDF